MRRLCCPMGQIIIYSRLENKNVSSMGEKVAGCLQIQKVWNCKIWPEFAFNIFIVLGLL